MKQAALGLRRRLFRAPGACLPMGKQTPLLQAPPSLPPLLLQSSDAPRSTVAASLWGSGPTGREETLHRPPLSRARGPSMVSNEPPITELSFPSGPSYLSRTLSNPLICLISFLLCWQHEPYRPVSIDAAHIPSQ